MRRLLPLLLAGVLAGCASRAAPVPAAPSPRDEGAPAQARKEPPRGRPAGTRIIQFGPQRTFWVEHCPTDSPSPLREQCSLTRSDVEPR